MWHPVKCLKSFFNEHFIIGEDSRLGKGLMNMDSSKTNEYFSSDGRSLGPDTGSMLTKNGDFKGPDPRNDFD